MEKSYSKIEEIMFGKVAGRITEIVTAIIAVTFIVYIAIWIIVS